MDFLSGLNPQQREAAAHVEGPLLILAGAGSGKTRVITHRIAHLIDHHRVIPAAILAVTFTNKAAEEMRKRVGSLLEKTGRFNDGEGSMPRVSTFHSFCVRLLRRDGDALAQIRPGFNRRFVIYDDDDQVSIVKQTYKKLGLDEKFMKYRGALSAISNAKCDHTTPEEFHRMAADPHRQRLAVVYDQYEQALRNANALDFDDLLLESVRLLRHDAPSREAWNRRLGFLMIDEYQDTNRSQYELMHLLSDEHKNVAVVGDEDQSIYSWRGADIRNILDFEKDYANAKVIRLEQNYRSTKTILAAAGAVVANNTERKGKTLWADSEEGAPVSLYTAADSENEALFIADTIDRQLRQNPEWRVAILYRTNAQSRQIEEALRRYGRKYNVVGGFSFYQRAEVKDVMAYLKLAIAPHDSISLLRVINTPARGIGKTTVEQIERYALETQVSLWTALGEMLSQGILGTRANAALRAFQYAVEELTKAVTAKPLGDALKLLLDLTGYRRMLEQENTPDAETRLENLKEVVNAAAEAAERGESIEDFLDHAALVADSDQVDEVAQINLLTLHNAKGLEFPLVFLAGMEEGLFPHMRSLDSTAMMEEERRLCYVGMTRAEKRLYLSWARYRRRFGSAEQERTIKSRFLAEVPEKLLQPLGASDDTRDSIDLTAERWHARETVKKNLYTGKTYNSLENIAQFFSDRGIAPPPGLKPAQQAAGAPRQPSPPAFPPKLPAAAKPPAPPKKVGGIRVGASVRHPKYGPGVIVRREGDGEDAKITVSFQGHGLKKLIEKYAGITVT